MPDLYINTCRCKIEELNLQPLRHHNLSADERRAITELKQRDDIVVKPADKGGAVVVWRKDVYLQEAQRQLADAKLYDTTDTGETEANHKCIDYTVKSLISEGELPDIAKSLFVSKPRTSVFYLLPKIHKIVEMLNRPGRPIVSAIRCPTEQLSSFLDFFLSPIVKQLPTYVHDTITMH
jgi:hypothetical protein